MKTTSNTLKPSIRRELDTEETHISYTSSNGEEVYQYEETSNMENEHEWDLCRQTEGMLIELSLSKDSSVESTVPDVDLRSTFGCSLQNYSSGSS